MSVRNYRLILLTLVVTLFLIGGFHMRMHQVSKPVFSNMQFHYGAVGDDVYELQGRLTFLGFYFGHVDGEFGYKTLTAVKNFQYQFGMKVDGIVGAKTKLKLWEATKAWAPTAGWKYNDNSAKSGTSNKQNQSSMSPSYRSGISSNDIMLMANAVYGEARGEPYEGQVAVAAVILNRVKSPSFPNTVSGVIFQPGAFTAVSDGQIYLTPNATAKRAAMDAVNGIDPTNGCIYYFNPATATSRWIWSRPQVITIGKHIFCM